MLDDIPQMSCPDPGYAMALAPGRDDEILKTLARHACWAGRKLNLVSNPFSSPAIEVDSDTKLVFLHDSEDSLDEMVSILRLDFLDESNYQLDSDEYEGSC